MPSFTVRTDAETEAALLSLGVSPDDRNRSRIVKEAILHYAQLRREMALADEIELDASLRRDTIDSAIELLRGIR